MAFTNPARSDGLVLSHWRRVADEGKEYPFAKFNKSPDIPTYTEEEYTKSLTDPGWSKEETDHLFEL
jgi:DNA methyltransferase 1-associated protein 1